MFVEQSYNASSLMGSPSWLYFLVPPAVALLVVLIALYPGPMRRWRVYLASVLTFIFVGTIIVLVMHV